MPTDVTQSAAAERMVRQAFEAFGGLDIVVINAGVSGTSRCVEESDPAAWRAVIEVNLLGAYHCARAAIPALKRRGAGKIITVGSGRGHRGAAEGSHYAVSKAGLWMLTRVLAQELADSKISVNELIPGPVATRMTQKAAQQGKGASAIPGEWTKAPEDVVPLAMFLATQPDVGPTAQSFSLMRRDN